MMHPSPAQRPTAQEIFIRADPLAAMATDNFIADRPISVSASRCIVDTGSEDWRLDGPRALHTPTEHVLPLNWG